MSTEVLLKGFFCLIISLVLAADVFFRDGQESGKETAEGDRQRYLPYIPAMALPCVFLLFSITAIWNFGVQKAVPELTGTFLGLFLHISVYDMFLLMVLPLLRKQISARACALLWIIPTYLYFTIFSYMEVPEPLWVIAVPEWLVWALFLVWFAGFAFVMIWKMISHLIFRRLVLEKSEPVMDAAVLEILESEVKNANFKKPKFKLVRSCYVRTPLSIGLFRKSMRIVLPARAFTEEEYHLIFRHELVHIGREDAWTKFFLIFCVAVCWFNPFMWVAEKKSAEDLELSCDEAVLQGGDASQRQRYAELLLKAAGDDRGFTTCLSSAASAMRYRLKEVVGSGGKSESGRKKKHSGAFTVALFFFLLCMSCGYVSLAYGEHTGMETIFQGKEPSSAGLDLYSITVEGGEYYPELDFVDASAVNEYLANLTMQDITGRYSFPENGRFMDFAYYGGSKEYVLVQLYDSYVKVLSLQRETAVYYLPEGIDWDYLDSICPGLPDVEVRLFDEGDTYGRTVKPVITSLVCISDGESRTLKDLDPKEHSGGIYSYRPVGERASLSFTMELVSNVEIIVWSWNWESSNSLTPSWQEKDGVWTFPLSDDFAHYTVHATFRDENGADYVTEFRFNIGSTNEDGSFTFPVGNG